MPSSSKLSLIVRVPGNVLLYVLDKLCFIPPVRACRLRISSFYNAFCAIYQFASTVDIDALNRDLALLPHLADRLAETELKLAELTERFDRLATELECESDCTLHSTSAEHAATMSPKSADTDDDGFHSSKSRQSSGANGQTNGTAGAGNEHANGHNGDDSQPPPPPPPPNVEDFRFTSTPNHPVFLSRGKLHSKAAKGSTHNEVKKSDSFGSDEDENDGYVKQECKKQRVLAEDLLHQRNLLRKFVKATPKKGSEAGNSSIEEDDGSLNTLMTNALKRKFATVNDAANSLNESSLVSEETTADFTL